MQTTVTETRLRCCLQSETKFYNSGVGVTGVNFDDSGKETSI